MTGHYSWYCTKPHVHGFILNFIIIIIIIIIVITITIIFLIKQLTKRKAIKTNKLYWYCKTRFHPNYEFHGTLLQV